MEKMEEIEKIEKIETKKINWKKWILFGSLIISLVIFSYYFGDMIQTFGG